MVTTAVPKRIRLITDVIKPKPKQQAFFDAVWQGVQTGDPEYILFGGAAGPGKSYGIRWGAVVTAIRIFQEYGLKGVRQGIFCETYPTLRDRHLDKVRAEFPSWLGQYHETTHDYILAASLGAGQLSFRNLDDVGKYDSAEFAVPWVDELTKNPKSTFDLLRSRKRWVGVPYSPFVAATNPKDIGLPWVRKLWIERDYSGDDAGLRDRPFFFLPALPSDNDSLPPSYYDTLNSLSPALRRALLEGDWYVFQGQAFPDFVPTKEDKPYHVIPTDRVPEHWRKVEGHDWGYAAPASTHWYAVDPEGGVVVYRELVGRGWQTDEIAQLILEKRGDDRVNVTWCDPSIWAEHRRAYLSTDALQSLEQAGATRNTIAADYAANGLTSIQPANNARLAGKQLVHRLLKPRPDGVPYLRIMDCCSELIKTLRNIQLDPSRTEDVITEYAPDDTLRDDCYDDLRYALMGTTNIKAAQPKIPATPPTLKWGYGPAQQRHIVQTRRRERWP